MVYAQITAADNSYLKYKKDGDNKLKEKDFDLAIKSYSKAIEIYPDIEETYFFRAKAKYFIKDYDGTIQDLNKCIEKFYAIVYNVNGKRILTDGDVWKIKYPGEFPLHNDVIIDAYILKGDIKFFLKDYSGAVKAYNKLLFFTKCCLHFTFINTETGTYGKRSMDDMPEEKCSKIFQNYNLIINLKPFFAEAYLGRGKLYYSMSYYNKAIQDYDKAIELNPFYADAYYYRGRAKKDNMKFLNNTTDETLNNKIEYISDYTKAINLMIERDPLNPNLIQAYYGRASAKEDLEDYRGAINDWSKIIELEPDDALAYQCRSDNKFELNDYIGGIEDLNKALEISPHHCLIRSERAQVKQKMGDYKGAIQDYNKIIENCSSVFTYLPMFYIERGICKIKLGFKNDGCLDFSKAGELGHKGAYDYIKKYCN